MKLYNKEFVCERCGGRYLKGSPTKGIYGKELYPISKPIIGIKYIVEAKDPTCYACSSAGNRIDLCADCLEKLTKFLSGEKIQSEMPVDISNAPKRVSYFKEA